VSGASSAPEDNELAEIGAAAVGAEQEATYLPHAFATGGLLLETPRYAVDAGRRNGPGAAEAHATVTDVMYAVEGTATVRTGDTEHELTAGDALVIPSGVRHEFVAASDPFLYFVVKVED
jgi:mannose-6-phosphate isomerase-like protein (cupin superfamily)